MAPSLPLGQAACLPLAVAAASRRRTTAGSARPIQRQCWGGDRRLGRETLCLGGPFGKKEDETNETKILTASVGSILRPPWMGRCYRSAGVGTDRC
jgi:hypothetical protein